VDDLLERTAYGPATTVAHEILARVEVVGEEASGLPAAAQLPRSPPARLAALIIADQNSIHEVEQHVCITPDKEGRGTRRSKDYCCGVVLFFGRECAAPTIAIPPLLALSGLWSSSSHSETATAQTQPSGAPPSNPSPAATAAPVPYGSPCPIPKPPWHPSERPEREASNPRAGPTPSRCSRNCGTFSLQARVKHSPKTSASSRASSSAAFFPFFFATS